MPRVASLLCLISLASHVSLSGLDVGATRTFRVGATVPATLNNGSALPRGDYVLVATVTPDSLQESTMADNTALGAEIITVANPFIDLSMISGDIDYQSPVAPGALGTGTVILRNTGNIGLQHIVNIQFFVMPNAGISASLIGERSFLVSVPPGESTPPLTVGLTLDLPNDSRVSTSAKIFARIDPASLTDANPTNDAFDLGTVLISSQIVDLVVASASNPFAGTQLGGDTATGKVLIGNVGSGLACGNVTVRYFASLSGAMDGSEVLLGSATVPLTLEMAQLSAYISVPLTLPTLPTLTTYNLFVQIVAPTIPDINQENNVTTSIGTVIVLPT